MVQSGETMEGGVVTFNLQEEEGGGPGVPAWQGQADRPNLQIRHHIPSAKKKTSPALKQARWLWDSGCPGS